MNTILIIAAVYGVPMLLALALYSIEGIGHKVRDFMQRRAVNKRLDGLR